MRKVLILFILLISILVSQEIYYEGIEKSKDLNEARKNALANLSESIQDSINSLFNRIITEEKIAITKDYTKNQVESYSAISLRNVVYIENIQKELWIVKSRVLKIEIDRIFLERKSEIRSLINTAKQSEKNGDISGALKKFYWAYLLSCSIPDTLYVFFPDEAIEGNARTILIPKIESIINNIDLKIEKSFIDEGEHILKLNVVYMKKSIQNLSLSYYDGKFLDCIEVHDGNCYLTQSSDFDSHEDTINILVEYQFKEEMEQNSNVLLISKGMEIPKINNNISISLDLLNDSQYNFNSQKKEVNTIKESIVKDESVLSKNDIETKTSKNEIDESQSILKELMKLRDLTELSEFLRESLRQDMLIYGNSDDFEDKEGLYTVILDIDTNNILDVMQYKSNSYINMKDNGVSNSLADTYCKHKIAVIWIEFFN